MNIIKRWLPYIFILAFQPFNNACNSTDYCTCKNIAHFAGKLYSCNNNTITVKSVLMIGKGIHITCHNFQKNNLKFLNYLKGIDTNPHVDNFVLEYCCQFADLKLVDIFHAMNISTVNTIKIMNNQNTKKATNFYNLENLTFVKSLFVQDYTSKLTDYTFNDMSALEKLYLKNVSNIRDLPGKIFHNLFNLKELTLESNNLNSLDNYVFQFNSNLSYFNIRNNNLSHLPHDLFTNLSSLEEVIMEDNKFKTVPANLFKLCSKLWNLSFKNNLLETLSETTFKNLSNLEELDLSYNKLEFLNDKLFHSLKQLRCLHLTANRLKSINSVIFSETKYLTALFLNINNLTNLAKDAFQTFKYIQIIDLSNNPLPNRNVDQILPCQSCRYLQKLTLQNISLTKMPSIWPSIPHTMMSINLAYNNLTLLKWDNLPFELSESQHINIQLHDNNITQLPRDDVEKFIKNTCTYQMCKESKITLKLKNNKINCDCHIFNFIKYLKKKHADVLDHPKITTSDAYCYWPESLRNTSLEDVNTHDLLCPLNDINPEEGANCPSKCSCQYRKEDNGVIVNCTGVGLNKFPNKLPNLNSKIELWFANNSLKSLKELSEMSPLPDVAVLSVSNNQLTDVHQLEKFDKLEVLELDNNKITFLTNRSVDNLKKCFNLTLHNNPWKCDCQTQYFINYIRVKFQANYKYFNNSLNQIQCDGNGKLIYSLENNFCYEDRLGALMIILYVLLAVFGILLIVTITLYFIFDYEIRVWMFTRQFFPKFILKPEIDNHKIYDVFVSVSNKDQNFIMDHLIPQLENNFSYNYKLFIQCRDYVSGGWIANQIKNTIRDSSRIVFILSKNYVQHEWSRADFRASHLNAIQDYSPKIIVILLDQVKIEDLDTESKPFVVKKTLKLCESGFWEKLRYELPHPPAYSKPNKWNGIELRTRTFQC